MKADELMIGDWVHVEAHRGFNAQNVKVETIPDNDGDNKYGYHYGNIGTWLDGGDNDFRDVETKHLQPIPLTPEILEKNGFVHYDLLDFWMWKKESFKPVHLDKYDKDEWRLRINCDNIPCECKYVHQLKHALRLCGIEKEIVL